MFDNKNIIHTLGFKQYLGFHLTILVVSSPLLTFFFIECYLEGHFCGLFHLVHVRDVISGDSFQYFHVSSSKYFSF